MSLRRFFERRPIMVSHIARTAACFGFVAVWHAAPAHATPITLDFEFEVYIDCLYVGAPSPTCSFDRYLPISVSLDDTVISETIFADGTALTQFGSPQLSHPFVPLPPLDGVEVVHQQVSWMYHDGSDGAHSATLQESWWQFGPKVCDEISCQQQVWANVASIFGWPVVIPPHPPSFADLSLFLLEDGALTFLWHSTLYTEIAYTDAVGGGVDLVNAPGSRSVNAAREAPEPTLIQLTVVGAMSAALFRRRRRATTPPIM
jgi:hypothetical protein